MNQQLRLTCFNGFRAKLDHQPIANFYSARAQALLAYLAVEEGQPQQRATLAGLLWPDYTEKRARRNLSQTLTALRKDIGDQGKQSRYLTIATQSISIQPHLFAPGSPHWLDVAEFTRHRTAITQHVHDRIEACVDCTAQLQQAADLYTGPFLEGFVLSESDLFENWIVTTREKLHQQALDLFLQLSRCHDAQGNLPQALTVARRLLELAPWQEEAHRQLMLLLARSGQRTQALTQYDSCAQMLMDELGVVPSSETDALYDQILEGELPPDVVIGDISSPRSAELMSKSHHLSPSPTHLSPFQAIAIPPHFVGRDKGIQEVVAQLISAQLNNAQLNSAQLGEDDEELGGPCIVALVGMGGVGKTTLAASIAHAARDQFTDGVLWTNSATTSPQDTLDLWGRAYGYDFSGLADLESRATAVRGMLADKQTLLVLDNVESATQVRPLLPNGEACAVLMTTRNQELAVAINAQSYPVGELTDEGAIDLLTHVLGGERVNPQVADAAALCALLHRLPLAVEIAAQRLKSRPRLKLAAMVKRLSDAQQRLNLGISDQAVRTSFAVSWDGLDKELQHVFALLGLFAGRPFAAEAIAYLADIDAFDTEDQLDALVALSLLNEEGAAHYRQHPLLADYAQEMLSDTGLNDSDEASSRLVKYYLAFAEENCEAYAALEAEWGNISAAIEVAHELERWETVVTFTDLLADIWLTRGRYSEARQAYALAQVASEKQENVEAQARNLLRWGEVCAEQNDYDEAEQFFSQSLVLSYQIEEEAKTAEAQFGLARIAIERGEFDKAARSLEECLSIRHMLKDDVGIASALFRQAWISLERNNLATTAQLLQEAFDIAEGAQDKRWLVPILRLLAQVAAQRGEFALAHGYCERALHIAQELQDRGEIATLYYTWTIVYRWQGKFDEARVQAEQAIVLFQQLGLQRAEGMVRYQLSAVLTELGKFDVAVTHLMQSIHLCESTQNMLGKLYALTLLGDVYQMLEQPRMSLDARQEAMSVAERVNDPELIQELGEKLYAGG